MALDKLISIFFEIDADGTKAEKALDGVIVKASSLKHVMKDAGDQLKNSVKDLTSKDIAESFNGGAEAIAKFNKEQKNTNLIQRAYNKFMQSSIANTKVFGVSLNGVIGKTLKMSSGLNKAGIAGRLMGIGLLGALAPVVIVLGAMAAALFNTQKGIDFMADGATGLGSIMDTLTSRVSEFGLSLFEYGEENVSIWSKFKSTFIGLKTELIANAAIAITYTQALREIGRKETEIEVKRVNSLSRLRKLGDIIKDTERSDQARFGAVHERFKTEQYQIEQQIELQQKKFDIISKQNEINKATVKDADIRKAQKEEIILIKLKDKSLQSEEKRLKSINDILERRQKINKKLADDAIKELNSITDQIKELSKGFVNGVIDNVTGLTKNVVDNVVNNLLNSVGEIRKALLIANEKTRLKRSLEAIAEIESEEDLQKKLTQIFLDSEIDRLEIAINFLKKGSNEALQAQLDLENFKKEREKTFFQVDISDGETSTEKPGFFAGLLGIDDEQYKILDDAVNSAKQALDDVFALQVAHVDRQIELQQTRVDKATELADKGRAEQLEIEEDRLSELQEKREKYVQAQRALAAIEIVTANAVAAAKGVAAIADAAALPFPVNILAIAATATAMLGNIAAVTLGINSAFSDIPGFAEGEEYIQGAGTSKSDSILARLSKGERVTDAETNSKMKGISNAELPAAVRSYYEIPRIKKEVLEGYARSADNTKEIRLMRKDIRSLAQSMDNWRVNIKLDKDGFAAIAQKRIDGINQTKKLAG